MNVLKDYLKAAFSTPLAEFEAVTADDIRKLVAARGSKPCSAQVAPPALQGNTDALTVSFPACGGGGP